MDATCKEHDITYDCSNLLEEDRNKKDYILEYRACEKFKALDSDYKEKASVWGASHVMKIKRKMSADCEFILAVNAINNMLKNKKMNKNMTKLTKKKCVLTKQKVFLKNNKKTHT